MKPILPSENTKENQPAIGRASKTEDKTKMSAADLTTPKKVLKDSSENQQTPLTRKTKPASQNASKTEDISTAEEEGASGTIDDFELDFGAYERHKKRFGLTGSFKNLGNKTPKVGGEDKFGAHGGRSATLPTPKSAKKTPTTKGKTPRGKITTPMKENCKQQ